MHFINQYQLFLFDFDGLLVNTEQLHHRAYQAMCRKNGFDLQWDEKRYAEASLFEATGLKDAIYATFPALQMQEPRWEVLYEQKKQAYQELLQQGLIELMPGVSHFLQALQKADKRTCVVTHSSREQVGSIRRLHPILENIPYWITREDYKEPKPAPDGYLEALARYLKPGEKAIGFEDSPRGLRALAATIATPVLVTPLFSTEQIQSCVKQPFLHYPSFEAFQIA